MDRIYLDYAATTPLDNRVLDAMLPYFSQDFGNPSSAHYYGQAAEGAIEKARCTIKRLLNADDYDVIFTSGGSESDNLALRGAALEQRKCIRATKLLMSSVEHDAVSKTTSQMQQKSGFIATELRVDKTGLLDLENLKSQLNKQTAIVSVIYGNNEIGTINPIKEIARICHEKGILFHTDAVQAAAHLKIDMKDLDVDYLSISAHKLYGPKGVGLLIKKRFTPLLTQITGGGQESGLRAGTSNVPSIVGLARAMELTYENLIDESKRLEALRDRLIENILNTISDCKLTGDKYDRLPNHASFVFEGVSGNDLLIALDMAGFAVSSGSACKVGNPKPSQVLLAIGIKPELALGSLRVTLGKFTIEDDINSFIAALSKSINRLRQEKMRTYGS